MMDIPMSIRKTTAGRISEAAAHVEEVTSTLSVSDQEEKKRDKILP